MYNFKNFMHGTRGFLGQITNQLISNKYFCQNLIEINFQKKNLFDFCHSNFFNYKYFQIEKDQLLPPFESQKMSGNLFEKCSIKFGKNLVDNIVKSDRVLTNRKVYHSKNYNRKGETNSFTVNFIDESKSSYGDICFFFEFENEVYCFIEKFVNFVPFNSVLPKSCGLFNEFVEKHFSHFYDIIDVKILKKNLLL